MDFGSFIEPVLSRTWDPLVRQIRYLVKAKTNIDDMDRALGDLKAEKRTVLETIKDGKRTQQKSAHVTERWLVKVAKVEAEVEANKERYAQRGCVLLGTCSLNCWSTYKASRKASQLYADMAKLKTETEGKDISQLVRTETIGHGQSMPTSAVETGVLKRNVAKIQSYLKDDTVGVIGIHGMGGVGKTTLLNEINNLAVREKTVGSECRQAFVVVSKECQLRTLQTRLAKSLGLHVSDSDDDNEAAIKIFNYLKEESFLLLLDDMWEAIDYDKVGIPYRSHSSNARANSQTKKIMQKVVITTRDFQVCGAMGADKTIEVECLDKENALILFYESVGAWIRDSSPNIKFLAEKVASECGGLPLALSVIGKAMRSKTTPDEWRKALTSLRKPQAGYVVDKGNEIFTRLEFSYRNLSDDRKQCFLFCSLWPEDYPVQKDDIIAYCIGQGYVNDFDDVTEAWDTGNCLIEDLKRAGLLESTDDESRVKMHDVLRDLALWIQSDYGKNPSKCLVKAGMGLSEAPRDSKIWAEAQVISLMRNDIQELGPTCFNCHLLLRFTVRYNASLGRIHHGFFQHMPALTFLDLSGTAITELPPDIGDLKMLQHLDLSRTEITCLPKEVGNLLKLRYLDLSYTRQLKDVPSGVISRLLQLQVLDVFACSEHGVIDRILLDLESSLQHRGSLKALSIVVRSCEQFQRLSKMPRIFTRGLGIRGLRGLSPLNLTRNMWRHALELEIVNCTDTRELIFDGAAVENDDCCPAKRLNFEKLYELEEIIWRGLRPTVFLPYLCEVRITECHRLKDVSWVVQLPSLTELKLSKCNGLEQVIQHLEATTFPSLTILSLVNLPELTGICGSATITFPALRMLYVSGCPKLMLPESPERPTVFLPYLCEVRIIECHSLKNVSWVVQLPSLTELELSECDGLEQVIGGAQAEEIQHLEATTFPSLTVLSLADLPELTCICGSAVIAFPALRSLYVRGCPKLKEFPFQSVDMNKLEDLMFDEESWKGLQEKPDIPAPKFSYRLVS